HKTFVALYMGLRGIYTIGSDIEEIGNIIEEAKGFQEKIKKEYISGSNGRLSVQTDRTNILDAKRASYGISVDPEKGYVYSIGGGIVDFDFEGEHKAINFAIEDSYEKGYPVFLYFSSEAIKEILSGVKESAKIGDQILSDYLQNKEISSIINSNSKFYVLTEKTFKTDLLEQIWKHEQKIFKKDAVKNIIKKIYELTLKTTKPIDKKHLKETIFLNDELGGMLDNKDTNNSESNGLLNVYKYALYASLRNASMQYVVSSPTGGASGIFPAIVRYSKEKGYIKENDVDKICDSLLVAAATGAFIANSMSIAGSKHGCLAEIGTSIAMATAFMVSIKKERVKSMLIDNAIASSLLTLQGLACDPLYGYVEIPCVLRNFSLSTIPIILADAILSGYKPKINAFIAVATAKKTGELLAKSLKETGSGPLTTICFLEQLTSQTEKDNERLLLRILKEKKIRWEE
ncbi:MAG: L-serine ammonia-lyase, iron-sulfur-dependent, subunit alpha, partial [Candidatus Njordarchaeota archaeon]